MAVHCQQLLIASYRCFIKPFKAMIHCNYKLHINRIHEFECLQFGDASGIQSPVSFGGFGSLTRHLGRLTTGKILSYLTSMYNILLIYETFFQEEKTNNAYVNQLSSSRYLTSLIQQNVLGWCFEVCRS